MGDNIIGVGTRVTDVVGLGGRRKAVGDAHAVAIDVVGDALGGGGPVEDNLLAVEFSNEVGGAVVELGVHGGQGVDTTRANAVVLHGVADAY